MLGDNALQRADLLDVGYKSGLIVVQSLLMVGEVDDDVVDVFDVLFGLLGF